MNHLKMYGRFIIVYLKAKTEYGMYYFMDLVINTTFPVFNILTIWVVLQKFGSINHWSFYEVLLLYNINHFSFSFSATFVWGPSKDMESFVREGTLDGILTKPLNPLLHLIFRQFSHGHFFHLPICIYIFYLCFKNITIDWSIFNIVWFAFILMGAALIQSAIMIFSGSMSFWLVKSTAFSEVFLYGFRNFINYPISIYHKLIQILIIFIIPFAFINFIPMESFLHKQSSFGFDPWIASLSPLIGAVMLFLTYTVWKIGINRYQGTGS